MATAFNDKGVQRLLQESRAKAANKEKPGNSPGQIALPSLDTMGPDWGLVSPQPETPAMPASEALVPPPASVALLGKTKNAVRQERQVANQANKLLQVHYSRQHASAADRDELAFMPNWALMAALPYSEPDAELNGWTRTTARCGVVIQPGLYPDAASGKLKSYGYPFGIYPRLLLLWLTTHVQRSKELEQLDPCYVDFGSNGIGLSLQNFLFPDPRRQLSYGKAGTFQSFKTQLIRLLAAHLAITSDPNQSEWQLNKLNIVDGARLQELESVNGVALWKMGLQLNKAFHARIMEQVVPLDLAVVKAFGKSAQCIDIYAWLSHQAYIINNHVQRERLYDWKLLESFFGGEGNYYTFRTTFKRNFRIVALAWPGLGKYCELSDGAGLSLKPGVPLTVPQTKAVRRSAG